MQTISDYLFNFEKNKDIEIINIKNLYKYIKPKPIMQYQFVAHDENCYFNYHDNLKNLDLLTTTFQEYVLVNFKEHFNLLNEFDVKKSAISVECIINDIVTKNNRRIKYAIIDNESAIFCNVNNLYVYDHMHENERYLYSLIYNKNECYKFRL